MKPIYARIPLLVFALVVTAGSVLLYGYMYTAVNKSFVRAALARSVLDSQKQDRAQAQNTLALYQGTSAARARLDSLFIPDSQAVSFIESLESLGQSSGAAVELSAVSADDASSLKPGSFAKISARVSVTGSWPAVMRALMLSEILPYQASVDGVSLDSSETSGGAAGKTAKRVWRASYGVTASMLAAASSSKPR